MLVFLLNFFSSLTQNDIFLILEMVSQAKRCRVGLKLGWKTKPWWWKKLFPPKFYFYLLLSRFIISWKHPMEMPCSHLVCKAVTARLNQVDQYHSIFWRGQFNACKTSLENTWQPCWTGSITGWVLIWGEPRAVRHRGSGWRISRLPPLRLLRGLSRGFFSGFSRFPPSSKSTPAKIHLAVWLPEAPYICFRPGFVELHPLQFSPRLQRRVISRQSFFLSCEKACAHLWKGGQTRRKLGGLSPKFKLV